MQQDSVWFLQAESKLTRNLENEKSDLVTDGRRTLRNAQPVANELEVQARSHPGCKPRNPYTIGLVRLTS